MRNLTGHIVENDATNHQLTIDVTDQPAADGANHRYEISGFETGTNVSARPADKLTKIGIVFQNGPIKEVGVNGLTHECLLAIIIDRLRVYARNFPTEANQKALEGCEAALYHLKSRTRERIARGVEGTHQK